ncbi:MAG: PAS domain-containing protein [Gammaproteobacteria bacterium]|nr:PAS domain-containing protein [Gammaproteobacteria bacterium]
MFIPRQSAEGSPDRIPRAIDTAMRHLGAHAPVLVLDGSLRVRSVSPDAARVFGRDPAALIDRHPEAAGLVCAVAWAAFRARLGELADGPACLELELERPRDAGALRWRVSGWLEDGGERFLLCTVAQTDAATAPEERPAAAAQRLTSAATISAIGALDERSHLLDFALRASRDGLMYWDIREDKVWWSDRYAEILGMRPGEVRCRAEWLALLHPDERDGIIEERLECARAGRHFLQEYRMRHVDGHYVWVSVRGQTELDAEGDPVRQVALITDVSERRGLLEELRLANELAQLHLVNTPLIYIKHDDAFVIEEWSPRTEQVLGWRADEAVGRTVGQLGMLAPSRLQYVKARYARALADGEPVVSAIGPCYTKDGRLLSIEWHCRVLPDERGGFAKLLAFGLDRSEQVAAERALKRSEERLNLAMRATNDGIFDWNLETGRFWGSPRYAAILGFPAEEIELSIGEIRQRVHPEDATIVNDALLRHFTGGQPFTAEYRVRTRDGTYIWHYARGESVFDADGKAKRVVGVVTDVTQRKIWEHELAESERRFRDIADSTPVIIWLLSARGECVYANRAFREFTGRPVGDELGLGWMACVAPQDRERITSTLHDAFEMREEFTAEWRHRHYSGEFRWVRSCGVPRFGDNGEFSGYIGTTEDIDAQRQAWSALETANQELMRSNAELEQFAYVASHDLQEPLRMVASFTQLLAKKYRGRMDAEADEYIHFAVDGAKRMQKLIQDLLTFSRVGRGELHFTTVDTNALVGEVVQTLKTAVAEAGAVVTCADLPTVRADESQLAMVFQNLIGNSLKYRAPDRPPQITISAAPGEDGIEFTVEDNGIGFEPRYADRIFVIFQRLHTRETYPGTGIGLSIVKKVIERLGGRIRAEGRPGEGARFVFVLPV